MKKTLFSFTLIVSIIIFSITTSCNKDATVVTKTDTIIKSSATLKGLWEGTYLTNQVTHEATFASFTFYTDGSMLFKAKGVPPAQTVIFAKGKWSLSNKTLSFTDTTINYSSVVIQTGSFSYDSTTNKLNNGVWQNLTSDNTVYYTGTYPTMLKIN